MHRLLTCTPRAEIYRQHKQRQPNFLQQTYQPTKLTHSSDTFPSPQKPHTMNNSQYLFVLLTPPFRHHSRKRNCVLVSRKIDTRGEEFIHAFNCCLIAGVNKKREKCVENCAEGHRETQPGEEQPT